MPATQSTSIQRFAGIPLKLYASTFSVEGLQFGIDNLRYDVHFSPGFIKAARRMAIQLFGKFSSVTDLPGFDSGFNWYRGEDEFKGLCRDLMMDAVKRAKVDNQYRVQYLAMAAVAAVFREAVEDRHKACIQHLNNQIWRQEMAYNHERVKELRDGLQNITRNRETLVQYANRSLFQYLAEAQHETINDLHKLHFGPVGLLPDDFLANPLLHAENPTAEAFMMGEYVLLGSRREDVNQYEALQAALGEFLAGLADGPSRPIDPEQASAAGTDDGRPSVGPAGREPEPADWIKSDGNVDALFNFQRTEQMMRRSRRQAADKKRVRKLRQLTRRQKRLLVRLLRDFNARGLLPIILATEVLKAYSDVYCPPLTPHEVLSYIVDPKARKPIRIKLKRIRKNYGEDFTLQPLRSAIGQVRWMPRLKRMEILLDYVRNFARYHRDMGNYLAIANAINYLNFVSDDNHLKLSRANNSLYEFLLPNEQGPDEMPIISHTVVKADVRGSTGIVSEMKAQGLNPATNFSLNFFDPVTSILSRFGAHKVFIEGDAIILAIFEYENQPQNWYGVARACGLAMNILQIVDRYNRKNRESHLPQLEFGIGISYNGSAPTFFFDEDHRIMISPAINQADRLSGCFKPLRELNPKQNTPFNVFVYEVDPANREMSSETLVRYNVNGIELSMEAFEKLKREIQLETLTLKLPGTQPGRQRLHAGSYPTTSGTSHQLVIREAALPRIGLAGLDITEWTDHFYYEVCTDPALLKRVKESR
ncbi:MAG: hypothetical protein QNJ04_07180 [Desulfobacterales bacterium]|nr:hypothetical protein [Desulfobacterales bacterium]